jgi:hypothetical protein
VLLASPGADRWRSRPVQMLSLWCLLAERRHYLALLNRAGQSWRLKLLLLLPGLLMVLMVKVLVRVLVVVHVHEVRLGLW